MKKSLLLLKDLPLGIANPFRGYTTKKISKKIVALPKVIHFFWLAKASPPIYIIASLSIIFYISHWIIAGDIILSDFMQVVYCQPIDNSSLGQVDNVSEITNAEVIIQPKNNQLAGESGPSQGLNSVKVSSLGQEEKKLTF